MDAKKLYKEINRLAGNVMVSGKIYKVSLVLIDEGREEGGYQSSLIGLQEMVVIGTDLLTEESSHVSNNKT